MKKYIFILFILLVTFIAFADTYKNGVKQVTPSVGPISATGVAGEKKLLFTDSNGASVGALSVGATDLTDGSQDSYLKLYSTDSGNMVSASSIYGNLSVDSNPILQTTLIRDNAGVPDYIIPGYDSSVTPGHTTAEGSLTAETGVLQITQESDVSAVADSGTGTRTDPYILTARHWDAEGSSNEDYLIDWDDTDADYWIQIEDSLIENPGNGTGDANGATCIKVNISSADVNEPSKTASGLFLDQVEMGVDSGDNGRRMIHLENGYVEIQNTKFGRIDYGDGTHPGNILYKSAGAGGHIKFTDCLIEGVHTGNFLFDNAMTGGKLEMYRVTHDTDYNTGAAQWIVHNYNWEVYLDRLKINVHDQWVTGTNYSQYDMVYNAGKIYYLATEGETGDAPATDTDHWTAVVNVLSYFWGIYNGSTENQTLGFTLKNSKIMAGNNYIINGGETGEEEYPTLKNALFSHNTFYGNKAGERLFCLGGKGNTTARPYPENVVIEYCWFEKDVNDDTSGADEVLEVFGGKDCSFRYNWINGCGEDAYEFHTAKDGNIVEYCAGINVKGQMVDIYSGHEHGTAGNGSYIHHIYGDCQDAAVLITNSDNVLIHDIHTNNYDDANTSTSIGAVVIEQRTVDSGDTPTNITVYGPIPLPHKSADSTPFATLGTVGSDVNAYYYSTGGWTTHGSPSTYELH